MKNVLRILPLTVALAACDSVTLQGGDDSSGEGELVTLKFAPELRVCTGMAPKLCMVEVSEERPSNFYQAIDGFTYQWGYEYELQVLKTDVVNPPADASKYAYSLVSEEKVAVAVNEVEFELQSVPYLPSMLSKDDEGRYFLASYEFSCAVTASQVLVEDCDELIEEAKADNSSGNTVNLSMRHRGDGQLELFDID